MPDTVAMSLLTADDVARRLGVKRATVYAYVSRGLLERHPASGHRHSLFDRADVERLAVAARHPGRTSALEVVVDSRITAIEPAGRLFYRGHDAVELARFRTFEQVAALLWEGDAGAPWTLDADDRRLVAALVAATPGAGLQARLSLAVAGLAASARPADRSPAGLRAAGGRMIAATLAALGTESDLEDRSTAAQLWAALACDRRPPRPAQQAALDAALVLLADHELSASTLAARVAASAWADPYRVVLAGMGALGGTLHGASGDVVERMLREVEHPEDAYAVLELRLGPRAQAPGFGHRVYRDRDPRADHLLGRLGACADTPGAARRLDALLAAAQAHGLPAPNVDLALAGLCDVMGLRAGSTAAIFTVARLVGLLAHAMEEYPHRLRFRPRARYVGPTPRT